ncbi:MAG: hypothetical protein CMJ65_13905 [Planctomycetaceae bacterium]|jgi:outer membrane protein assembly factor BamB|nr:hypothetical protein [Planctomycetaceae bacterium]
MVFMSRLDNFFPRFVSLTVLAVLLAGSVSKSGRAQTRKAAAGKGVTTKKVVQKKTATKAASGKKNAAAKPVAGNRQGQPPITAESVRQAVQQVLGRILGRGVVPAKGPAKGPAGNGVPAKAGVDAKNKKPQGNGDPNARDRIDLLAPQDPRQAKLLRQAGELAGKGQYSRVLDAVSILLDPPADVGFEVDSLFRRKDGRWVTVRDEANRLLGQLPESFLETFRTRFSAEADRRFKEAVAAGREADLVDVADRFFHTPAGRQAANRLGSRHVDRGRLGLAAFWFGRLLDASDDVTRTPAWRVKAAWVFHRVGQAARTGELLDGLLTNGRLTLPGGRDVSRDEWLGAARPAILPEPILADWPIFYGSASRRGRSDGSTPLLLSRWRRPLTHRHAVDKIVRELVKDLDDMGRAMIPAYVPLVVGKRAIYRTLRGIEVVDIDTGRVLWETRPEVAVESLMSGSARVSAVTRFGGNVVVNRVGVAMGGRAAFGPVSGPAENHPLTGLLFQHALHGIPASDGRRVFLVEERNLLAVPSPFNRFGGFNPFAPGGRNNRRGTWNTLAAYDLETGRPVWEAGGAKMDEPFDLPLAGTRFLGAPTPLDGRLYVVGERDNEVRLHVIDAATGKADWSRRIAYVDGPALADFNRRWASSHVAVSDGVAICPTTVGWLVGVECSSHRLLWAHRYARPQPQDTSPRRGMVAVRPGGSTVSSINGRWAAAPPIICGDRVVFTPHAESVLLCLDLFTGKMLWKKKRGSFLYVAGGFGDRLILVGTNSVAALELADGSTAWTHACQPAEGRTCGRGVTTDGIFHLPLSSGQICSIRLADGQVSGRTYLPESARETILGNLVMAGGMLLALGPSGMVGFEQRDALMTRIESALKKNPADEWATLKQAELALLGRDHAAALQHLGRLVATKLDPALTPRYQVAMRSALKAAVRADLKAGGREIERLTALADSPDRVLDVMRLRAEQAVARGDLSQAVEDLREFADRFRSRLIGQTANGAVRVRADRWVAGQLADLWPRLPATTRNALDTRLAVDARAVLEESSARQREFIEVFDFHPVSRAVKFHVAEMAARAGRVAVAELTWLRLAADAEPKVAARARAALDAFRRKRGLVKPAPVVNWPRGVSIVRAAGTSQSVRRQDVELNRQGLPWYDSHRAVFDSGQRRLVIERIGDGRIAWSVPLQQASRSSSSMNLPVRAIGHQLVIYHQGVIQALSPTTRKLLWSYPVEGGGRGVAIPSRPRAPSLVRGETSVVSFNLAARTLRRGPLCVTNPRIVCVRERRRLSVLETRTGKTLWQRDRIPTGAVVFGSDSIVYLQHGRVSKTLFSSVSSSQPAVRPPEALRASDGRRLEIPGLVQKLGGALWLDKSKITWIRNGGSVSLLGLKWTQLFVQQDDVLSGKTLWQHKLDRNLALGMLGESRLVMLADQGQFDILDLRTGQVTTVGRLTPADMKGSSSFYAFEDSENLYVAVNKPLKGTYYSINLHSVRVNGVLCAFDRQAAGVAPRWRKEVKGMNLILDKSRHAPLLVLASREYKREGALRYYLLRLAAVDKRTGQDRVSMETPSNYWSFNGLRLNLAERYLELGSYNQRIRLVAAGKERVSIEPKPKPAVESSDEKSAKP